MEKKDLIRKLTELLKEIKYDMPENFYDGEGEDGGLFVVDHQFRIIEDADMSKYTFYSLQMSKTYRTCFLATAPTLCLRTAVTRVW